MTCIDSNVFATMMIFNIVSLVLATFNYVMRRYNGR